jgi:hypothetical protein
MVETILETIETVEIWISEIEIMDIEEIQGNLLKIFLNFRDR